MRLHYVRHIAGNFGDELNTWIWHRLLGRPLGECLDDDTMLVGIGSMLNHRMPARPARKIVLGSGIGYGRPSLPAGDWQWLCVRGPRTRDTLNLPIETPLGDSGVLIREFFSRSTAHAGRISFMPHVETSVRGDWKALCDSIAITYIDPAGETEDVIRAISQSSLLVSESLHGAIVADALRIPWVPVRTNNHVLDLKWHDWLGSVGMAHYFVDMPGLARPWMPKKMRGVVRRLGWEAGKRLQDPVARRSIYARSQKFGWSELGDAEPVRRRLLEIVNGGMQRRSEDGAFRKMYEGVAGSVGRLRQIIKDGTREGKES